MNVGMDCDCRVLLCDDIAEYRALLRVVLEREGGHVVAEAQDGEDCIEKAGQSDPNLILLDLKMPRMGGMEALPQLRKKAPDAKVVVLTTGWAEQLRDESLELGATAFVEKPRDILTLPGLLRDALVA
jgi:CheY-like chemotaxis protein